MLRPGSADSPAAMPISSVPWKEKPTIIATPMRAAKPPANGASPMDQLARCSEKVWARSLPCRMPTIISRPTAMKMMTVMTLMAANQYSASPKPFTEMTFSRNMMPRNRALQSTPGTSGIQ